MTRFQQGMRAVAVLAAAMLLAALATAQSVLQTAKPMAAVSAATVAPDFSNAPPAEKRLHVTVGRSVFINTKHRLTRVYITNPTVLDSYTASPNQILATAKQAGMSSLIVWDESGDSQTYLVSSDMDVDGLRSSIHEALPHEPISVNADESRVILSGTVTTPEVADAAVKLASLYSKDVSNATLVNPAGIKQVRLKVRVVEIDRSKLAQLGFNLQVSTGKVTGTSSTNQFPTTLSTAIASATATNPLNFGLLYQSGKYDIGATLQDLQTKSIAQILAEPTITTLSGQKANFLAGGEFPFPVVQGTSGGLTSITIQFRSYGVKVEFTPIVNPDGTIELKVAPEVSALDFTNAVTISGYTIPALSTRRAETQVVLQSGQNFAISGLLDNRTTDSFSRTPGIASVPILGELFKSKSLNHQHTELVVIVTPTLVDPLSEKIAIVEPVVPVPPIDRQRFDEELKKQEHTKPNAQNDVPHS